MTSIYQSILPYIYILSYILNTAEEDRFESRTNLTIESLFPNVGAFL